ncbi:MAG: hypothetical protein KGJ80_13630, partial [Chloroflexota bacterium]|nr:hypothetical protein [Chloroflexota bacterium]
MLRLGLAGAGALLIHLSFVVSLSAPLFRFPVDVLVLIASGLAGLGLLVVAGLGRPRVSLRWLILAACVGEIIIRSVVWAQTTPSSDLVTIDPGLYTDLAGQLLRHGENPYAFDLSGAFDIYRVSRAGGTPRLDGTFTSSYPYPALPFVLVVPLQAAGLPGIFLVSLLAQITALILLFLASPKSAQPLILLPLVAGIDFTLPSLIGVVDVAWAALLVAMIIAWRKPVERAILFGLAIAFKQTPLLLLPFLLVYLWRDEDGKRPVRRVGCFLLISAATFLFFNMPFILWDPHSWLLGVAEPIQDSLILLSQGGLSSLTQFGYLNLSKNFYLVVTIIILLLLLFIYWRHYHTLRDVFWVMPGIFMWFSYRSLESYWVYWALPVLAVLVTRGATPEKPARTPGWRLTLAILAIVAAATLASGVFLAPSPETVQVRVHFPVLMNESGQVAQIPVEVTNLSDRVLTPRFALQHRFGTLNPLPWDIDDGPASLAPGQSAIYRISTGDNSRAFLAHEAAQVVVTDARGDYSLRGLATIVPDHSYLFP